MKTGMIVGCAEGLSMNDNDNQHIALEIADAAMKAYAVVERNAALSLPVRMAAIDLGLVLAAFTSHRAFRHPDANEAAIARTVTVPLGPSQRLGCMRGAKAQASQFTQVFETARFSFALFFSGAAW